MCSRICALLLHGHLTKDNPLIENLLPICQQLSSARRFSAKGGTSCSSSFSILKFGLVWTWLVLLKHITVQTNTFLHSVQLQGRCLSVLDLSRDTCNHISVHWSSLLCITAVIPRLEASSWTLGKTGFSAGPWKVPMVSKLQFSVHFMKLITQSAPSFQSRLFSLMTLWLKGFYMVSSPVLVAACAASLEVLFIRVYMSGYKFMPLGNSAE